MSEKLTKQVLKNELSRRIEWHEKNHGFTNDTGNEEMKNKSHHLAIAFGRYCAMIEIRWQIENNLFVGGGAS